MDDAMLNLVNRQPVHHVPGRRLLDGHVQEGRLLLRHPNDLLPGRIVLGMSIHLVLLLGAIELTFPPVRLLPLHLLPRLPQLGAPALEHACRLGHLGRHRCRLVDHRIPHRGGHPVLLGHALADVLPLRCVSLSLLVSTISPP